MKTIILLTFCMLFTGCASFGPLDLNRQIKSGQLVQKTDNFIVLLDNSGSMGEMLGKPMFNETRLIQAKIVTENMIATIPEIKLNAGLMTFEGEKTALIYGMKSLVKKDYNKAINSIEKPHFRSPIEKAITAAGNDLRWAEGNSAIIIVSDFSDVPGTDDIRLPVVIAAIAKVSEEFGDKLTVYAIQVGYTLNGKELSEQIVQHVKGGYTVNADKLVTPAAMADFVEKVISGNAIPYQQMVAKPREKVVIVATEPMVEKKVVAAVSETKAEEKVVILAFEDVQFDPDKSTLTPEAQTILKRNIQVLKDNPEVKVRIAGYTSASGTDAYNLRLSERRANAVQKYLINEGLISPDRLSTIGYGETDPAMYEAAPNKLYSEAAKANMRVIFQIIVQ